MIYALWILAALPFVAAQCTFPPELRGVWKTSSLSTLTFTNTTVTPLLSSDKTMSCFLHSATKYVVRSEPYRFGPAVFVDYTCLDFHDVSTTTLFYYQPTAKNVDSNNDRLVTFYNNTAPTLDDVCNVAASPDPGTYSFMMLEGSLNESARRCPDVILGQYNVTLVACPGGAELDVCTDKKRLDFNYTQCGSGQYSGEMVYNCLYDSVSGDMTYLTLYNDAQDESSNPFIPFSCVVMATSSNGVSLTHAPGDCQSGQTSTEVTDPGVSKQLTLVSSCEAPTTTAAPTPTPAPGTVPTVSGSTTAASNTPSGSTATSSSTVVDGSTTTEKNSATTRFMEAWTLLVTLTLIGWTL
ncbi:uncharacterized protein LOC124150378 isoform X1 [Haliotis rufescens]|uniref:uncharacterized protein LOC124150378 isoform X1 n=1 Tax=Haliotis rufescens TaxID=6454 RepID=UPI00201EF012|nr:uncharacterized protein LOC124150378 isoform X1 [Haliotis rufescens]